MALSDFVSLWWVKKCEPVADLQNRVRQRVKPGAGLRRMSSWERTRNLTGSDAGSRIKSGVPLCNGHIGLARQHRLFSVDTISSVRIMGTHHFSQKFNF